MNKKTGLIILVLLALSLSACSMSASTPPPSVASDQNPLASPTLDPMDVVGIAASETAAAGGVPMDSTPVLVIVDATETPAPDNSGNPDNLEQPTLDPNLPTPTEEPPIDITEPTPEPPQNGGRPETYTLKQGEFAYCIARRFDVDPDELLALNGLIDSEILTPGTVLNIPSGGSFPPPRALKAHPDTYTVQSGDTIYSVACLYGDVRPGAIANANGLEAPYNLPVGESIQIP